MLSSSSSANKIIMEKLSVFANKGGEGDGQGLLQVMKKLPVGFHFLPTDEELLIHYLRNRTSRLPLPASTLVPELDVFRTDPWNLPGDQREKRYFFCRRISTLCSQDRPRIATNSGHWKTLGKMKRISTIYGSIRVAGARRTLAFRNNLSSGHDNGSLKSSWMLHEISLTGDDELRSEDRDWSVYRLFHKKKMSSRKSMGVPQAIYDSPCSSSITTEIPRASSLDEEEISSFSFSS